MYTVFQTLRLLRLAKLLRIIKLIQSFKTFQLRSLNHDTLAIMKLVKIGMYMLLTAHYFACFFYLIGTYAHSQGQPSWIQVIIKQHGAPLESVSNITKYSYAFYWATVTLFTTGYGDIHAANMMEQWTCSVTIIIGSCFFAYFIGLLYNYLINIV